MKLAAYFVCPTECWRDARDRITAFQKGSGNSLNPMEDGRGDHYWSDAEGQLADAYYGAVDPANNPNNPVRIDYFPYDELGNRVNWNFLANRGWTSFGRRDNRLNQYVSWAPVSNIYYDDNYPGLSSPGNGVLMADGYITASYNALNQPTAIWAAGYGNNFQWFGYDPLGRCVKRWMGPVDGSAASAPMYFVYDGWNLVQEGNTPWSPTRFYIQGGRVDEIVQSYNSGTGLLAYHYYDASGHCTLLTDGQGTIKEQYYYDAFGLPRFYDAAGTYVGYSQHGNRFLFTGREWLSDLHLYDYRNRLYQPELGRFMQPDPKEFAAGDYNLYRYCHNDPVNNADPSGLDFIDNMPARLVDQIDQHHVGQTFAATDVKVVQQPDGTFTLRADVTIVDRTVANKIFWHGKWQLRTDSQRDATREHENVEHSKDWKGFHDAKQREVPDTKFKDANAAKDAAKALQNRLRKDAAREGKKFEDHKPDSRWKSILERERP